MLGLQINSYGLEVDKAKIEVIKQLPLTKNLKCLRGLLGHASFSRRFFKDFVKIFKL